MSELILCEQRGPIAIVTIDRPKALNALNIQVLAELYDQFEQLADSKVKVIILTGSGEKSFVAGADIDTMRNFTPDQAREFAFCGHRTMNLIESMNAIVIAAVNGYALGGGCELALACDIRIASSNARMAIPEVSLGIIPGFGGTQRLPRLIGLGKALEMLSTGRQLKADECLSIGLVNQVVEQETLLDTCINMAESVCKNSATAVAAGKTAMREGLDMDLQSGIQNEAKLFSQLFESHDQREGMAAFLEKRAAVFE